ncbi:DivIVA domain-containing protein [bacterium]|nr:DivIVA domain-containing protein [bacterium]
MKITPLDLRKPDLKRVFKGYDVDEVRGLLSAAADSLEESLRESLELKNRLTELGERLKNYQNMESTLNETLIMAQKAGEASRQAAQRESELIVAKAEVESERILDSARARLREMKFELEHLEEEKQSFLVKMRSLVASQWKLLQEESAVPSAAVRRQITPEPYRRENDFSEGYFEEQPESESDAAEEAPPVDTPPAAAEAAPVKEKAPRGFEAELERASGQEREDSVTSLSRKLGEFLRARETGRGEAPAAVGFDSVTAGSGEDNPENGSTLSWGGTGEPAEDGKPDVFWGDTPEEPEQTGKKGGRKK